MWASATPNHHYYGTIHISCHTHSHVGFCNDLVMLSELDTKVVIPTHMWASATESKIGGMSLTKLSYPLTCGLLQRKSW